MSVSISIPDLKIEATIEGGEWTCNDAMFLPLLEAIPMLRQEFYYDPDPDHTAAQAIIKEFGGKITYHDEVEYDPEVTY